MFRNFFIIVGGIFLSLINLFRNISLENISFNKDDDDENANSEIFSKLNFQLDTAPSKDNDNLLDRMRDVLLLHLANKRSIFVLLLLFVLLSLFTTIEISGIYLMLVVMLYVFIFYYPQIRQKESYSDINHELPYALRHMGIELKSGKGLHDTLMSVANSDYGSLSKEFNRVLKEVKYGKSTEDSLLEMSTRIGSDGVKRTVLQIIGTLRVGGNLATSLEVIAKDISFDSQIKLKEYSQKLNSFILIYTFIAILAPVISLIMLMAGSTVMGDVISGNLILIIYGLLFPMIVMFMGLFVKKLEPKI